MVPHIITNAGVQVVLLGRNYGVSSTHAEYNKIISAIYADMSEYGIRDIIEAMQRKVSAALKLSVSLTYKDGVVYHHATKLRGYAVDKLINLIQRGEDVETLANFLTKVQANPDQTVIDNLYEFLEVGKMSITKSGDFLAYKAIRGDWKDIHSGSISNVIGSYISMPRRNVDPDRNQTCSYGYHVCSFGYLPHFTHVGGHVVVCQINPADVVAIPADYNNTKMRVSSYRVIDEVTEYYDKGEDVLATTEVWNEDYFVLSNGGTGWVEVDIVDAFEDAVDSANDMLDTYGVKEVKVVNEAGRLVYYKQDTELV